MNSTIETYKIFSDFYDLYVGKFVYDFDFYKSYCKNIDKILEIGCGTGRILNLLLHMDCKVTGIDISQEMLDKASEKYHNQIKNGRLTLINHDFTTNKLNDSFDNILLTFYTFNYILDRPIEFLKNVYNSLNDKGLLLMDLFYPNTLFDKSINGKWINKEYNIDGQLIKIQDCRTIDNDIEHRQQVFIINGTETKINTKRKYFSPLTLKEMLNSAGYHDIEFSYDYDYNGFKEMIDETRLKNNYIVKVKK
jgi:cyclopropane fatty-acyl-phospholipid synthase-like methyltransferase